MSKERLPKDQYFRLRYEQAVATGNTSKAAYYQSRLASLTEEASRPSISDQIDETLEKMGRSIVATPPSREALDSFAEANNGSSDYLLTQMAVQFGYVEALREIKALLS